jgi:hypothetical protein
MAAAKTEEEENKAQIAKLLEEFVTEVFLLTDPYSKL